MGLMIREGNGFVEFETWCEVLTLHEPHARDNKFTIRYVGTRERPKRPIDRLEEDLSDRRGGILAEFQSAIRFLYPDKPGQTRPDDNDGPRRQHNG
ncbi:hypothetical protein PG995_010198 [Apiospora arundinis]|uniref:Uncharacterized protein n=1 Tax=Apiospora arundinis TaxID=335852 RepID=A0ABR2ISY3_9PEZI